MPRNVEICDPAGKCRVRGEHNSARSQQAADRIVGANTNALLVVVPGDGRVIPIEAPAAFEATVHQWLCI